MDSAKTIRACSTCGRPLEDGALSGDFGEDHAETCDACGHPDPKLVTVLETADDPHLMIAKSILESAGIPYLVRGDEALGLLPLGGMAPWPLKHGVAAAIRVPAVYAEDARTLLVEAPELPDSLLDTVPELQPDDAGDDDAG